MMDDRDFPLPDKPIKWKGTEYKILQWGIKDDEPFCEADPHNDEFINYVKRRSSDESDGVPALNHGMKNKPYRWFGRDSQNGGT